MSEVRLATRKSPLALAQAAIVANALKAVGVSSSVVPVVTTGDRDPHTAVTELSEVGAFVRAVQGAVLDGRADAAVHSGKDLPVRGPESLVSFHPHRASPYDVMCGSTPAKLAPGAKVGTGSPRRAAQLRLLRPDVEAVGIRGNVGTRVSRVRDGRVDAVILATAGLERLGLEGAIDHRFELHEMVPAPAQAALTVEAKAGSEAAGILGSIDRPEVRLTVEAERELLALTGAGCRSALGALAVVTDDGRIRITGFVADERGPRRGEAEGDTPDEAAASLRKELGL